MKKFNNPELSLIRKPLSPQRVVIESESSHSSLENSLLNNVFVSDPVTGYPCSDVATLLSQSVAPEIADFIRQRLLSPTPHIAGSDSPDLAVEVMRRRGESFESYQNRLTEIYKREKGAES